MSRLRNSRSRLRPKSGKANLPHGLAAAVLWLLILVVPLIFVSGATDNFRLPKKLASESLALLSLALLAAGMKGHVLDRLWRSASFRATVPLLMVASLGLLTSEHPSRVLDGWKSLLIGAAALCGWSLALDGKSRRRWLCATLVPAVVVAAIAVLQFHRLYTPFEFAGQVSQRFGLTSLAGGAFDLAGYLILPLLIVQVLWRRAAEIWWRVGLAWIFVLALYAVALTQTFTVLLALAVGSLVISILRPPSRLSALVTALILVVGLTGALKVGPLAERIELKLAFADDVNHVLTGRLDGWRAARWMFMQHPVSGVGQGVFGAEFADAKLTLSRSGTPFYGYHTDAHFVSAHNEILEIVAECGLPGLLALGWLLWIFGRALKRRFDTRTEAPEEAADELVLAAGMGASIVVLMLFNFPFHLAIVAYPALLLASGVLAPPDGATATTGGTPDAKEAAGRRWGVALAALLAIAWGAHYLAAERQLRADRILAEVELTTQRAHQLGRLPESLASRNLYLLREAARLDANRIGIPVAQGWQYLLRGRTDAAIETFDAALVMEPRAEIYANLGQAHLLKRDHEAAREAFRRAIILDPQMGKDLSRELDELGLRLGNPGL